MNHSAHRAASDAYGAAHAKRVSGELTDAEWKLVQREIMIANSLYDAVLKERETAHQLAQRYCAHCGQPDCKLLTDY